MTSLCILLLASVTQAASTSTLTGRVQDDAGRPIAGATVFINTAAPRKGLGTRCPSCYPDCRTSAVSDVKGEFALKGLDPELKFQLLVVARGFLPTYTPNHLIPETVGAVIALKPHDLDARKPERVLCGRVEDENGSPVARAVVEPTGLRRIGNHPPFTPDDLFGPLAGREGFDLLAVTDDKGEFRLGVGRDNDALYLLVRAPFLAPVTTKPLRAGKTVHTVKLGVGVTVMGRVVKHGRPLAGVGMGMVQVNRDVTVYVGHVEVGADARGQFSLANISPNEIWSLYGLMDTLRGSGSISPRTVTTKDHGSTLDVGDIEVQPGYRLTGRIVLSDAKPVPPDTRVAVSRDGAVWDSQAVIAEPDGRFTFDGLPPERVRMGTTVSGYHLSPKIASIDLLYGRFLWGTVKGDIHNLLVLLDPGPDPPVDFDRYSQEDKTEDEQRRSSPLRGASVENVP